MPAIDLEGLARALDLARRQGMSEAMIMALLDLEGRAVAPTYWARARYELARWRAMRTLRRHWRTSPIQ